MNSAEFKRIKLKYLLWISSIYLFLIVLNLSVFFFSKFFIALEFSLVISIISLISSLLVYKPFQKSFDYYIKVLHQKHEDLEYSLSLFFKKNLNSVERIQKDKIAVVLNKTKLFYNYNYLIATLLFIFLIVTIQNISIPTTNEVKTNLLTEKQHFSDPSFELSLTIKPPDYTKIKMFTTNSYKVTAPEFSELTWNFNPKANDLLKLVILGKDSLNLSKSINHRKVLRSSFLFKMIYGNKVIEKESELYHLEAIADQKPELFIQLDSKQFEIDLKRQKTFSFQSSYSDDYGLSDFKIILTLAKGNGEAIKFKELERSFRKFDKKKRSDTLQYTIDFSVIKADYGDELYFFVQASDNRPYQANNVKSDNIFISFKDTARTTMSYEAGLALDRLPEYFMSQRQIIIDTEKLIKNRKTLSRDSFFIKSNELAFYQKLLRRRYGNFLGEEFVNDIDEDALKRYQKENPESKDLHFMGDGHEHSDELSSLEKSIPASALHDHDKAEQTEYFDPAIKHKLKMAITEMWTAELHLRLSEAENALIYEYKALKWIKEVQQDSRIYVERIGFDPPKVKIEESRLKGEFDNDFKLKNIRKESSNTVIKIIEMSFELLNRLENQNKINKEDLIRLDLLETYLINKHLEQSLTVLTLIGKVKSEKHIEKNIYEKAFRELKIILKKEFYYSLPKTVHSSKIHQEMSKKIL
jgi:hypothetical protein